MGFTVEPDAISAFADQLNRYEADASAVTRYIDNYEMDTTYGQLGDQGVIRYLLIHHESTITTAKERAAVAVDVALLAAIGMNRAATFYVSIDAAEASRLDATYPSVAAYTGPTDILSDSALGFRDAREPTAVLVAPDGGDLGPKAASLARGIGLIADYTSLSWWARQFMIEAWGVDPFREALEIISGDWEAMARYADGWRRCGTAFSLMTQNMSTADEALSVAWQGNAADAAIAWVQRFTDATSAEAAWFEYQVEVYRRHIEGAHWMYEMLNYLLGELLDIVALAAALAVSAPTMIVPLLIGSAALVDRVMGVIDAGRQGYHLIKLFGAAGGSAGEEPESVMRSLLTNTDGPGSYRHPSVAAR